MLKVLAVVVTYHPRMQQLEQLLKLLKHQVQEIIIIDNSVTPILADWFSHQIHTHNSVTLINNDKNLGLGAAHNLGIQYAKLHFYDFVLQLDQDSIPDSDMVQQLLTAYQRLVSQGNKVAAVGPNWVDKIHDSKAIYTQHAGYRALRQQCPIDNSEAIIATDYLITSGCLIPIEVLDEVGNLNESLFIDFVDIEWGLRAKNKGYQSFGVCSATLTHELGDEIIKILWRSIHAHSPLRHYYTFRNLILLSKKPYIPVGSKVNIGLRYLLRAFIYPIIFKPRLPHLKMILLGILHGIRGISGPYHKKN